VTAAFGPDTVYMRPGCAVPANDKAKRELRFRPRPLDWLLST
jgi:hypothetical protein